MTRRRRRRALRGRRAPARPHRRGLQGRREAEGARPRRRRPRRVRLLPRGRLPRSAGAARARRQAGRQPLLPPRGLRLPGRRGALGADRALLRGRPLHPRGSAAAARVRRRRRARRVPDRPARRKVEVFAPAARRQAAPRRDGDRERAPGLRRPQRRSAARARRMLEELRSKLAPGVARPSASSASTSRTSQGEAVVASMVVVRRGPARQGELPALQAARRAAQRRLRGDEGSAVAAPDRAAGTRAGCPTCCWSTAAAASSRWRSRRVRELGVEGVELASLAKDRVERDFHRQGRSSTARSGCSGPGAATRSSLRRNSNALFLLQQLRDEAHRFAITFHRKLRAKQPPALGARRHRRHGAGKRRKALLAHFGSVKRVREASVDELAALPEISRALAEQILAALAD